MNEVRLIDANTLKEEINKKNVVGRFNTLLLIDEAPTVEITEKQAILFLINSGWLVNHDKELRERWERPQGEWKLDETEQFCYCSNCEDTYYSRPLDPSWYYCPHCGANMEGGQK